MISVCMIAKNEEKTIERCLQSLQSYPFEIIVVDTGSTDRTKEIVSRYTKNIYDFQWTGDFSEARNYSISKASHDWILILDCDEYLEPFDVDILYAQLKQYKQSLGTILIKNSSSYGEGTAFPNVRIFNRQYYRYQYRIHEQPVSLIPQSSYDAFSSPLSVIHTGYDLDYPAACKKYNRNIDLLKQALTECDADSKPYFYFQLAQSYGALYYHPAAEQKDSALESACFYYEKALKCAISPSVPYYKLVAVQYGSILFTMGQYEKAIRFLEACDGSLQSFADYNVLLAKLYIQLNAFEKSRKLLEKAITLTDCFSQGSNTYVPYYYLGILCETLGSFTDAAVYYSKCVPFSDNLHTPAALLYYKIGKCYYSSGDYSNAVCYFDKGLSIDTDPAEAYLRDMVLLYGYSLLHLGQYADALNLEGIYDTFGSWGEYLLLLGTIYMKNGLLNESIETYHKAVSLFTGEEELGLKQNACYNIGVIYECMQQINEARHWYEQCGRYPPALERLTSINKNGRP